MNLITHLKLMFVNNKEVKILLFAVLASGLLLFSIGCKKTENTMIDYDHGVGVASDYTSAQHLSTSIANTYFKAIYDSALMITGRSDIDGAVVKYLPDSVFQLKIIYPYWGVDDGYGNWRQGEIHIKADGGFFNENENAKFYFENFYFTKDTIVAHDYSLKYLGNNSFQMVSDSICRILEDTSGVIVFNSQQIFTVILSDGNEFQPEYLNISGLMNGITREGFGFRTSVNTDIVSDLTCNWMKQGEVEIIFDSVDFDGTVIFSNISVCENWYNLVIDDVDFPSSIQKPKWR